MADLNNNTFYLTYKDVRPCWPLIGRALSLGIIATFGIMCNSSVIFVTIRTKSLRGTANYFLALYSFSELLHQFGHFLNVFIALSGHNFIEFRLAAKILLISVFGVGVNEFSMLLTGIDRLITLCFSKIYDRLNIRLYLFVLTFCAAFIGCLYCIFVLHVAQVGGDRMITGCVGDLFADTTTLNYLIMFIITMSCVVYLTIGILTRIKAAGLPSSDQINRRIFRALFCIITINNGGYFVCNIYLAFIRPSISSPTTAWFGLLIAGILLNIGAAANGPILYLISTEYRQAFRAEFAFLIKRFSCQSQRQVAPSQSQQQQRNNFTSTVQTN